MFKVEDILARLQNGEDAGDIANEMINTLNTANDQYQKEEEAKAKAKKAAEANAKKEAKKLSDLQNILDLMHDFCIEYYCDTDEDINTVEAVFSDLDAAAVDKMIEEAGAYAVKMVEMEDHLKNIFGGVDFGVPIVKVNKSSGGKKSTNKKTADTVIADFLKNMGL